MDKTIQSQPYSALINWLKGERQKAHLSQRQLGQLLDVPHSWVNKVEQHERRIDLIEYVRICHGIGIDPYHGLALVIDALKES